MLRHHLKKYHRKWLHNLSFQRLRAGIFYCISALFISFLFFSKCTFAFENNFYILRANSTERISSYQDAINQIEKNAAKINILIPQAYHIDAKGNVTGSIDPETFNTTNQYHIKLMPLVTNSLFEAKRTEKFLANTKAQQKALQNLLTLCQKNHFYGLQFDFEGLPISDKNLLSSFFNKAAITLHQAGFAISIAVIPTTDDQTTAFLKRKYENWSGVYDLKMLGNIADFITIMSYDQHSDGTTPGSFASVPWMEATIQHTLRFVPAEKISLGVPSYSAYWQTSPALDSDKKIRVHSMAISYEVFNHLKNKYHLSLIWNDQDKLYYVIFQHHWLNEYIFVEDARAFQEKLALVKKHHLRGISYFDIGNEDPDIWEHL